MVGQNFEAKQKKSHDNNLSADTNFDKNKNNTTEQQQEEDLVFSDSTSDTEEQNSDSGDRAMDNDEIDYDQPEHDEVLEDDEGMEDDPANYDEAEDDEANDDEIGDEEDVEDESDHDKDGKSESEDGEANPDEDGDAEPERSIQVLQQAISDVPSKLSSTNTQRVADFIKNWYSYLLNLSDKDGDSEADPDQILSQLSCLAELWKKIFRNNNYDNKRLDKAIPDSLKRKIDALCRELEDKYTDLFAKHMISRNREISNWHKTTPPMGESAFYDLGKTLDVILGSPVTRGSEVDARWWGALVPNFHNAQRYSIVYNVSRAYHEYKIYQTWDQVALLKSLIWRNLRNLWVLAEWHDMPISVHEINLENDFFSAVPVSLLFRRTTDFPDFMNPEGVQDAVACYSQFINLKVQEEDDQSSSSITLAANLATEPLQRDVLKQLYQGAALTKWNTSTIPALRTAVARLNFLNGEPLQIQGETNLAGLWEDENEDDDTDQDDESESDDESDLDDYAQLEQNPERDGDGNQDEAFGDDDDESQHDNNDPVSPASDKSRSEQILTSGGDGMDAIWYPALQGRNVALANDYVFHPFPENRAVEVAQSRLIHRDLKDPGIKSDGLLTEDCVNLPPAHCRPPGTYTGHTQRDPRGPYEVLRAVTKDLIRSILQRPRRLRKLPLPRPAPTSRAACRSRKIFKLAVLEQSGKLAPRHNSTAKVQKSKPTALSRGSGLTQKSAYVHTSSNKKHGTTKHPSPYAAYPVAGPSSVVLGHSLAHSHKDQGVQLPKREAPGDGGASEQANQFKGHAPTSYTPNNGPRGSPPPRSSPNRASKRPGPQTQTSLHPRDYDAHDTQDVADGKVENVTSTIRKAFEAWQASFPDEDVGPERTQTTRSVPTSRVNVEQARRSNQAQPRTPSPRAQTSRAPMPEASPLKTPPQRPSKPKAVASRTSTQNPSMPKAATPKANTQKAATSKTQSSASVLQPTKKAGKSKKAPKTADRKLQNIELSPQNINKRTRAQRRNIQVEMQAQGNDSGDDSDDDHAGKKAETDNQKTSRKKSPKTTGATKDTPYKPRKGDGDSDGSENAHSKRGKGPALKSSKAGAGERKSSAKGKQKAQPPASSNATSGKKKTAKAVKPAKKTLKRARNQEDEEEGGDVVENPPKRKKASVKHR